MPDSLLQPWGIPSGIESENALIICISVSYEVKHGNVRWQAISKKPKEYFSKLVLHGPARPTWFCSSYMVLLSVVQFPL